MEKKLSRKYLEKCAIKERVLMAIMKFPRFVLKCAEFKCHKMWDYVRITSKICGSGVWASKLLESEHFLLNYSTISSIGTGAGL